MSTPQAILKPTRERSLLNRHPWIFSGALQEVPNVPAGTILPVLTSKREQICSAYFNPKSSLCGRVLAWGSEPAEAAVKRHLRDALRKRQIFIDPARTNAYRLVNAEGDELPGLIVDVYGDTVVLQIGTRGMELLKPLVLETLQALLQPKVIRERSLLSTRKEEGLEEFEGVLHGTAESEVQILENGVPFIVSFEHAQKTGLFLDQREMRTTVGALARNRNLLNCFSFSGGFSVFAGKGGAQSTVSVDLSEGALALARRNLLLSGLPADRHRTERADVFDYLRAQKKDLFGFIVLDPPAFAKKKVHVAEAAKGYNEINRLALERIRSGGLIATFSCSHYVDEALFRKIIFSAARDARREVSIVQRHVQAPDHPVNVFHPEGEYLKGFVLAVT